MLKTTVFASSAALALILSVGAGAVTLPEGFLRLEHSQRSVAMTLMTEAVSPGYEAVEFMLLPEAADNARTAAEARDDRPRERITAGNVAMPALAGAFGVIGLLRLRSNNRSGARR